MSFSARRDMERNSEIPVERELPPDLTAERRGAERRTPVPASLQDSVRQIVDCLADGVVIVSDEGVIRFANPAAERLFGRSSAELVGREFGFPLSSADPAEIEIVRRGDTPVVCELRSVETTWESEAAMLVSLRDVTDRKDSEQKSRQLEREKAARLHAEAANQAKSDFLAVMSHELRTPLNAVIGYAELLDLGVAGALSPAQRQQVGRIVSSGRHLLGLVSEILDLSKVDAGRLSVERVPVVVAEVVDAAIVLAQPQAEGRGLTLVAPSHLGSDLRFVGDRERALQILVNLLSNAIKFTEPGGTVRLDVVQGERPPESKELIAATHWLGLRVTDTGIGIHAENFERIFSPFVQGDRGHTRRTDGTGLGLTISRRLARLMHGDVVVQSVLGEGSAFTLWLPAPDDPTAEPPEMTAAPVAALSERTRGLRAVGDALMHEIEAILDAFVARLHEEPLTPIAAKLKYSQLADHVGAMLADIASALVTLEDSEGTPTMLLSDAADLQRFIADRHGMQRARLGWTSQALARQHVILREETERAVRRCFAGSDFSAQVDEALRIVNRYLEQGAETSKRALEREQQRAQARRAEE
jgi:signal transduction histidine kinase